MDLEPLPRELEPTSELLKYYAISSLVAGPFFVFPLVFLYLRYRTLRYRLDEDGISMRWGALFRREVSLNYGRIQDIHLTSNVVERWLGLGKIQIQTASASSKAEMTIEGVPDLQAMRDFLYDRMKGARGDSYGRTSRPEAVAEGRTPPTRGDVPGDSDTPGDPDTPDAAGPGRPGVPTDGELAEVLREVAAEVRSLRESLERRREEHGESGP